MTLDEKITKAYEVLRLGAKMSQTYYKEKLIVSYSGGKDSDTILQLALESLDPNEFEVVYSHTTMDAPEVVNHIRDTFKKLNKMGISTKTLYPKNDKGEETTIWREIVSQGVPPTQISRWCCRIFKEQSIPNRFIATGVRAEESSNRQGRDSFTFRVEKKADAKYFSLDHTKEVYKDALTMAEKLGHKPEEEDSYDCTFVKMAKQKGDLICQPIYEWTFEDVWDYLRGHNVEYCKLYDEGWERLGCIGCVFNNDNRYKDFTKWPTYRAAYIRAFDKMVQKRKADGKKCDWKDGEDVFWWWMRKGKKQVRGQMKIEDLFEE